MLRVMIFKGYYYLTQKDIVEESSSFCSRLLPAMRRLYLRACDKKILSLHFGEWLKWERKSATNTLVMRAVL